MNEPAESVILCEGYHDRAFWAGWLEHLKCTDPGAATAPGMPRAKIPDPFGDPVAGGQFAFLTRTRQFMRIRPCGGRTNIVREAKLRITQHATKPLQYLLVNLDCDANADGTPANTAVMRLRDFHAALRQANLQIEDKGADFLLVNGEIQVSLIRWDASDPPTPQLPNQQTLERLVSAAITAAYPDRGTAIATWLASRQNPPAAGPKEFAWSHMAGWYSEHGCDDFYRNVWRDQQTAAELEKRLRANGAWQIVESVIE